jgi:SP family sugar:H+ symporter-like MFS transporter
MYSTDLLAQQELAEIQKSVQNEKEQEKPSLSGLWNEPTILRRILVGMVLQMMQQLTGINYFFYYGTELFSHLHVGNGYITAVILGAVNFGATTIGLWIAKRFGHRIALFLGGIWIGTWLLVSFRASSFS